MNDPNELSELLFLKLGGSLITEKSTAKTVRMDVLNRLVQEIAQVFKERPGMKLLLGHGSGSYGHIPAKQYNTRQGVSTTREWAGFVKVWAEAAALNHLVIDALHAAGLPAIALPASASLVSIDGQVRRWEIDPILAALGANLLPVVYGDVIFDQARGGTIFSTEDLFLYLARKLKPAAVYLAGIEPGVWADFPTCKVLMDRITPQTLSKIMSGLEGSADIDVTGGMASKVSQMVSIVEEVPGLKVLIFSGMEPDTVRRVLSGEDAGTRISAR